MPPLRGLRTFAHGFLYTCRPWRGLRRFCTWFAINMSPLRGANLFWCIASAINMLHLRRSAGPISTLHRCCEAQYVPFNAHARRVAHRAAATASATWKSIDQLAKPFRVNRCLFQTSGRAVSEPIRSAIRRRHSQWQSARRGITWGNVPDATISERHPFAGIVRRLRGRRATFVA